MLVNQRIQRRPPGPYPSGVHASQGPRGGDDAAEADRPATFRSILFQNIADCNVIEQCPAPDFLVDLNLDQVINTITAAKKNTG